MASWSSSCVAVLLLIPALVDGHVFGTQEWTDNLGQELFGWHYHLVRGFASYDYNYGRRPEQVGHTKAARHRRLQPAEGDGDGEAAAGDGDGEAAAGDGDGDAAAGDGDGDGDAATGDGDGDGTTTEPPAAFKMKGDEVTLKIPCWKFVAFDETWIDAIEPCGPKVTIPGEGLTFTTPFGDYFVPGIDQFQDELEDTDNAFSGYTGWFSGFFAIFYAGYNVSTPKKREAVKAKLEKMRLGHMAGDEADPMMTPEEIEQAAADKLDPDHENFICSGNIYRLVCVMHPGEVGYKQWISYCVKGVICAYMQFYLPYNILTNIFKQWHYNGVKSPLYFGMNATVFFTQFAALGNVCHIFASKCAEVIEGDAQAVNFLVSHREPAAELLKDEERAAGMTDGGQEDINAELNKVGEEAAALAEKLGLSSKLVPLLGNNAKPDPNAPSVEIPSWILEWNEFFWCVVNISLTCFSAIVLMVAMFLKVATFTGDIMNIAVVAVSLYFVFDLDDKVMQSDPKLKSRFQKVVLKQTEKVENPPTWIKSICAHTVQLLELSVPFGLMGVVLISWKGMGPDGAPIIIGGDPFMKHIVHHG
jgi:hypothetical protein